MFSFWLIVFTLFKKKEIILKYFFCFENFNFKVNLGSCYYNILKLIIIFFNISGLFFFYQLVYFKGIFFKDFKIKVKIILQKLWFY